MVCWSKASILCSDNSWKSDNQNLWTQNLHTVSSTWKWAQVCLHCLDIPIFFLSSFLCEFSTSLECWSAWLSSRRFHVVVKWKNMIGSLSSGIWTTLQGAKFKKISSKSILSFQNKHFGRQFFKKIFADHVLYMKNITLSSRQRLLIFVFTSIVFCFVSGVRSWTRKPSSCLIGRSGRVTVPSSSCFIWKINKLINKRVTKKIVRTETVIWHYY